MTTLEKLIDMFGTKLVHTMREGQRKWRGGYLTKEGLYIPSEKRTYKIETKSFTRLYDGCIVFHSYETGKNHFISSIH